MVVYSLVLKKRMPSTPPMTYSRPSTSTTPAPPRAVFIGEVLCQTPAWLGEQTRRLRAMSRLCVIFMRRVLLLGPHLPFLERRRSAAQHDELRRIELLFKCVQQGVVRIRQIIDGVPRALHGASGGVEIARLAEQVTEAREREGGDAIARGCGLVGERLGTMAELLVIVGGEEEAAGLTVLEMREQRVGERRCELHVAVAPARLQQREHAVEHEGVIVEIGGEARAVYKDGRPARDGRG